MQKDWKEITKNSYNAHAQDFASFATNYRGKLKNWIEKFSLQLPKNASVLDVGCGAGRDALYFSCQGLEVTGIDLSEKLIEISNEKVPNGKFYVMDFESLIFPPNSFDGIWASASLVHLPREKLLKVLKNLNNILKENGIFASNYRVGSGERLTKEKRGNAILERFYAYYDPKELETLLNDAGFTNITSELDTIETGDWVGFFASK